MYLFHVVLYGIRGDVLWFSVNVVSVVIVVVKDDLFFVSRVGVLLCEIVKGVFWVLCCLSLLDACSFRCSSMGSMRVSACRWCVFESSVHPVSVRSAVFCIV